MRQQTNSGPTLRAVLLTIACALVAVALGACGGSDPSASDTGQDTGQDAGNEDTTPSDVVEDTDPGETGDTTESDSGDDSNGNGDDAGAVGRCNTASDCDDGLACTDDACTATDGSTGFKTCKWTLRAGLCLINNVCVDEDALSPDSDCLACDPAAPHEWSPRADDTACDDGDACTTDTTCSAGACGGGDGVLCNDDNVCTVDTCSPNLGCVYTNVPNDALATCDDSSACTVGDHCIDGACEGDPVVCNDNDPCTDDICDTVDGCTTTLNTAPCDDGNPCTGGDTCESGTCMPGTDPPCDDGNLCTIDICFPVSGCEYLPTFNPCCSGATSVCDDGNPCTEDTCDPDTAQCTWTQVEVACDDGNACTEDDTCSNGVCVGAPRTCDDANDCTVDNCNVNSGCFYNPRSGNPCNDGVECTASEVCDFGECVAQDLSGCACQPVFGDVSKVKSLQLGANEASGNALDIDGDGQRDNTLGPLGAFANEPLGDGINNGDLMLLMEFRDFPNDDFTLAVYQSRLDPANQLCDYQNAACIYEVDDATVDSASCEPLISIASNFDGTTVRGGGATTSMPFSIPLSATTTLDLVIYMVTIEMTPVLSGGEVTGFNGLLAGAVLKTDLETAIRSIDPADLPLAPESLIGLLDTLAPNDIDVDGDGAREAKSITLILEGIDGTISRVRR